MKIKRFRNVAGFFALGGAIALFAACSFASSAYKLDTSAILAPYKHAINQSGQILLTVGDSTSFSPKTMLYALEKQNNAWSMAFSPMNASIGRNGFAPPGEKREGDGRTPSGIFPLKLAFGYADSVNTKMSFRQALADDIWVDDPDADDYNRWTKLSATRAASYEMIKREDDQYKYGLVMEYNTDPVIKGHGSAIFLHVWKEKGAPTAGCVAVSEENMIKILEWLDPAKSPVIITGIQK